MYNRNSAITYAHRWALSRNPAYLDFSALGGDCTNFVSQCLFAGAGVMNFTPVYGWFYRSGNDRTPSWTGVEFLYRFLVSNRGPGPYASLVPRSSVLPGDIVQLAHAGERYTHAALIVSIADDELFVASHSNDAWMKPLSSYAQPIRRFLHIEGVR